MPIAALVDPRGPTFGYVYVGATCFVYHTTSHDVVETFPVDGSPDPTDEELTAALNAI